MERIGPEETKELTEAAIGCSAWLDELAPFQLEEILLLLKERPNHNLHVVQLPRKAPSLMDHVLENY